MSKERIEQISLPIEDVAVQERQVTIKVLTVGTKQVTQTLYRQMINEPIIDPDTGELRGDPWGRVNVHVDCEQITGSHFHVIWQKGQELRRTLVAIPWKFYDGQGSSLVPCKYGKFEQTFRQAAHLFVCARILEGWKPEKPQDTITFDVNGEVVETWLSKDEQNYWSSGIWRENAQKQLESYLERSGYAFSDSDTIYQNVLVPAASQIKQFKQTWEQSYTRLKEMDQLFIAVSGVWK